MKTDGSLKPLRVSELGHAADTRFHLGHAMRSAHALGAAAKSIEMRTLAERIEEGCRRLREHAKRAEHEAGSR